MGKVEGEMERGREETVEVRKVMGGIRKIGKDGEKKSEEKT